MSLVKERIPKSPKRHSFWNNLCLIHQGQFKWWEVINNFPLLFKDFYVKQKTSGTVLYSFFLFVFSKFAILNMNGGKQLFGWKSQLLIQPKWFPHAYLDTNKAKQYRAHTFYNILILLEKYSIKKSILVSY